MRIGVLCRVLCLVLAPCVAGAAAGADLRGHGGPVRALALTEDQALSGSFDTTAILWDAASGAALQVLRLHAGGVNAVAFLPDGRLATAGQDGRIGLWRTGRTEPERVIDAHDGPVSALAVSADGSMLASSGWDGSVRRLPLDAGAPLAALATGAGPLNGVAFLGGGGIAAAGHDGAVHLWRDPQAPARTVQLAAPVNALAAAEDGGVWAAGTDGYLRRLDAKGAIAVEIELAQTPLVSLARGGTMLAVGGIDGTASLVDAGGGKLLRQIVIGAAPVWALAFSPDGATLLAGGADQVIRAWDAATGAELSPAPEAAAATAALGDSRGARVFRACAACHTLTPRDGNRAGPTLHGLFGRRIASAKGYDYSPALEGMDIVWTPETVSALFEVGPMAYTPGTKMPEQRGRRH